MIIALAPAQAQETPRDVFARARVLDAIERGRQRAQGPWRRRTRRGHVELEAEIGQARWLLSAARVRASSVGWVLEGQARLVGPRWWVQAPRLVLDVGAGRVYALGRGQEGAPGASSGLGLFGPGWQLEAGHIEVDLSAQSWRIERL